MKVSRWLQLSPHLIFKRVAQLLENEVFTVTVPSLCRCEERGKGIHCGKITQVCAKSFWYIWLKYSLRYNRFIWSFWIYRFKYFKMSGSVSGMKFLTGPATKVS